MCIYIYIYIYIYYNIPENLQTIVFNVGLLAHGRAALDPDVQQWVERLEGGGLPITH